MCCVLPCCDYTRITIEGVHVLCIVLQQVPAVDLATHLDVDVAIHLGNGPGNTPRQSTASPIRLDVLLHCLMSTSAVPFSMSHASNSLQKVEPAGCIHLKKLLF